MALYALPRTALAESDDDGTNGSNIVANAVITVTDLDGGTVVMYDDADGTGGATSKLTNSKGQKDIYLPSGEYIVSINSLNPQRVTVGNPKEITTTGLINSNRKWQTGDTIETTGFTTAGDGGAARWRKTGVTGLSASTVDAVNGCIVDALGHQWKISPTNNTINLYNFGAAGDGVTDDWSVYRGLLVYCSTNGISLHIPDGDFYIDASLGGMTLGGSLRMTGNGYKSRLIRREAAGVVSAGLIGYSSSTRIDYLDISGVHFSGQYDSLEEETTTTYMYIKNVDNVTITNSHFRNISTLATAFEGCGIVKINGNVMHNVARDGFRAISCRSVSICNNYISRTFDDGIAIHTLESSLISGIVDTQINVENNQLVECQGIAILGGQCVNVSGNTLTRCDTRGIAVVLDSIEGKNTVVSVVIDGNTITDMMPRLYTIDSGTTYNLRPLLDDSYVTAISVSSINEPTAVRDSEIGSNGYPLIPYGLYSLPDLVGEANIAVTDGVIISNNVIKRTIPYGALWSTLGYGDFWNRYGESFDPTTSSAGWNTLGISLGGHINNVKVIGNTLSGLVEGVGFKEGIESQGSCFIRNCEITNNSFFDIQKGALSNYSDRDSVSYNFGSLLVTGNTFDLDPYYLGSEDYDQTVASTTKNRRDDGSWYVAGVTALNFNCRSLFVSYGTVDGALTFKENVIRNTSVIAASNASAGSLVRPSPLIFEDNELWIGTGSADSTFGDSNRGVGSLDIYLFCNNHVYYDSDVGSVNYGDVQDTVYIDGAHPTSGYYAKGHEVIRSNPSSGSAVKWVRAVTGTAHVLNTDWLSVSCD